jgi:hypothetical protein
VQFWFDKKDPSARTFSAAVKRTIEFGTEPGSSPGVPRRWARMRM